MLIIYIIYQLICLLKMHGLICSLLGFEIVVKKKRTRRILSWSHGGIFSTHDKSSSMHSYKRPQSVDYIYWP